MCACVCACACDLKRARESKTKLRNFNLQVLEKWEKYHCRSWRGIGVVQFFLVQNRKKRGRERDGEGKGE